MSLERGVCSCGELQVFSCYTGWKEARQATRATSTTMRRELYTAAYRVLQYVDYDYKVCHICRQRLCISKLTARLRGVTSSTDSSSYLGCPPTTAIWARTDVMLHRPPKNGSETCEVNYVLFLDNHIILYVLWYIWRLKLTKRIPNSKSSYADTEWNLLTNWTMVLRTTIRAQLKHTVTGRSIIQTSKCFDQRPPSGRAT